MRLRSGNILAAHMQDKRHTNGSLANAAGCSRAMVGHLRTGNKTSCSPELARNIARSLDVPLGVLFDPTASSAGGRSSHRNVA